MNSPVTKQLLFEHFAGRLTALQRGRLEEWLREPANRELYYEWLEEWERLNLQYAADHEPALHQSLQQIDQWQHQQHCADTPSFTIRRSPFRGRWLAIAATIVLCLTAGLYVSRSYWLYRTIETAYGEIRLVTLPDGSKVTLNAHSSLQLLRFGFGSQSRKVLLVGEATFSVKHTPTHQRFVVKTPNDVEVVVLGTEFNVFARSRGTQVVLNKGKIQLQYKSAQQPPRQLLMRPGDLVTLDARGKLAVRHDARPEVITAWQQHRFVFSQTAMTEIIALAQENYNLTVQLKDSQLADRTVSGTFQADNADEFLQVIAELLEINYSRKENTVTFFD